MIDIINAKCVNVMIGELGHHVWVCTEEGTQIRIKAEIVTLDDRRINKSKDES